MNHACAVVSVLSLLFSPSGQEATTVRDDLGRLVRLGPPPRRIVSLAPNITEILFALGLGESVVGVTRYCDFPPEAARKTKIGGWNDPDLERIRSLEPDLVLAYRGNPLDIVRRIWESGMTVFVLDEGRTTSDLPDMIKRIGLVTRREKEADFLADTLRLKEDRLKVKLNGVPTIRVVLILKGEGLWTCGSQSFVHDLLVKAAAVNCASDIPRPWAPLSVEALLRLGPEVLILVAGNRGEFDALQRELRSDPRLRSLKAVRSRRFVFLDENLISRFGPRLADALEQLARGLHPERFSEDRTTT